MQFTSWPYRNEKKWKVLLFGWFSSENSIKVDSEVNLAWILQMPFIFNCLFIYKIVPKIPLGLFNFTFLFLQGSYKVKIAKFTKDQAQKCEFWVFLFGIEIFSHPSCFGNLSYIHTWRAWSDQHCGWRVHLFNFSLTLDYQNFFDCLFSRLSKDFLKAFFTAKCVYKFIQIDKFNLFLFTDFEV